MSNFKLVNQMIKINKLTNFARFTAHTRQTLMPTGISKLKQQHLYTHVPHCLLNNHLLLRCCCCCCCCYFFLLLYFSALNYHFPNLSFTINSPANFAKFIQYTKSFCVVTHKYCCCVCYAIIGILVDVNEILRPPSIQFIYLSVVPVAIIVKHDTKFLSTIF